MKPYVIPAAVTALTFLGLAAARSSRQKEEKPPPPAGGEGGNGAAPPPPPPPPPPPATGGADPTPAQASAREAYLVKSASELVALARQNLRAVDPTVMLSIANELGANYTPHRFRANVLRAWAKCAADAIANPATQPVMCGTEPYMGVGSGQPPAAPAAPAGPPAGGGVPGLLPEDLSARIEYVLNEGFPQVSLAPINQVIAELAKYPGFEPYKARLEKRKSDLKFRGL